MRSVLLSLAGLSAVSNALGLASSLFVLHVYDRVLSTRSGLALVVLAAVFGAMVIVAGVLEALRARVLVRVANRLEAAHSAALARNVREWRGLTAGDAPLERMGAARAALASPAAGALFDAIWSPIFVLAAFLLHPALGFTILGCAAVLVLVLWAGQHFARRAQDESRRAADEDRRATGAIGAVMPGYRLAGAQGRLAAHWLDMRRAALTPLTRGAETAIAMVYASRTLRALVQILVLAVAAWLAVGQQVTLGGVFAASILAARALLPIEMIASAWLPARDALDALRRAAAFRDAPGTPATAAADGAPVGSLRASHAFLPGGADRPALIDIDLTVARGEVLGIMGPPGAGKSALLALLTGLAAPATGTVRFDDIDPASRLGTALPTRIGYVEQTPAFLPGTLADNIARHADPVDGEALRDACARAGLLPLLSRLREGLDTPIEADGRPLSPGERRMVALARVLFGRPSVLALDLPETEVGPDGESCVARAMVETAQAGGIVLVASHSPRLMRHATRIALLAEGRIVRLLSPQELLGVLREERRDTARSA